MNHMINSHRPRLARGLCAVLAVATVGMSLAGPASAGGNEPPEPPSDLTISGSVSLIDCATSASNVKVLAHALTYPFVDKTAIATLSAGKVKYSIGSLPRGKYRVSGEMLNNACPFGDWTLKIVHTPAGKNPKATANISYEAPQAQLELSGQKVAEAFAKSLGGGVITLDNHGTYKNGSFALSGATTYKFPAWNAIRTSIAESKTPYGIFQLRHYVDDVKSTGMTATWSDGGIDLKITFEDGGTEIPGYLTGVGAPVAVWERSLHDIYMNVRLKPIRISGGQLSFEVVGDPSLHGLPDSICVSLGGDNYCDEAEALWSKMEQRMEAAVKALLGTWEAKMAVGITTKQTIVPPGLWNQIDKVIIKGTSVWLIMM